MNSVEHPNSGNADETPHPGATAREPSPYEPKPFVRITHPEWTKNATIYQLNTRQFTPEGTFRAAAEQLPRLQALGATIIWLMPVHDIGVKNRKGTLGSPYAVKDYYSVNPEFGSADDLRAFISTAHDLGMYVILDWVANHTAWDSNLVDEHPQWYARAWNGNFRPTPWWNWDDIIDLDYSQADVREYMTKALVHWVKEYDIDGYRCDVAGMVPIDFWEQARAELDAVKPIFLLAEWESKDLHAAAFDMSYAWSWYDAVERICKGHSDLGALFSWLSWNEKFWPKDSFRMLFTSNHDKNAWEGTEFENFGRGVRNAIILSCICEGMPLIYNGQEAGYDHRLAFFEKDPIQWREHEHGELFTLLFALKKTNTALWNGRWGATMIPVTNSQPSHVLSFVRENSQDKVFAIFNFTSEAQSVVCTDGPWQGEYTDYLSGETALLGESHVFDLEAWSCKVFVK